METAEKVPATKVDPVANYIRNEIAGIQEQVGLESYQEAKRQILDFAKALVESGAVPAFSWKTITMDEAKNLFNAIKKLLPDGDAA